MSTIVNCSRRNFLKSSVLAGGLILGVHIPGLNGSAKAAEQGSSTFVPNAFLRIAKDGSVTVIGNHSEMGQGAYTSGAMTIAEELDADWTQVRVEPAPVDPAYNHPVYGVQITGGSTSTWSEWDRLRKAGAAARQLGPRVSLQAPRFAEEDRCSRGGACAIACDAPQARRLTAIFAR